MKARDHKGPSSDGDGDGDGSPLVAHALRAEGFDASEDGTGRGTPLVPVNFQTRGGDLSIEQGVSGTLGSNADRASGGAPCIAFSCKDHGADAGDTSPTLRAMSHSGSHPNAGGQVAVAFNWQGGGTQTTLGYDPEAGVTGSLHVGQTPAVAFDMRGREGGAQFEGPHDTANIRAASGGSSRSYVAQTWAVRRLTPRECERLQGFPDDYTLIPWRGKQAPDGPRYKGLGNSMACNVMRWLGTRIEMVEAMSAVATVAA